MSNDRSRRQSAVQPGSVPHAPPLPAQKPLQQRARDAAYKFIGYPSRPSTPNDEQLAERIARGLSGGGAGRYASLGATQNATASHKTGLEINTIAINESGTHALLGGKEIFKTVNIERNVCAEDINLRTAIRSTPTQASGRPRQIYSIDIADVAWAKGDCGDYVAAATSSGKIILYDLGHAGLQAAQLHEHFRQVHKVTFNPHRGNLLLSGSQDGTVRLWDIRDARNQASTLQSKRKYLGQSDGVRDVKWSPTDGVDFAFGTDSGWLHRWDIRNLKAAKVKIPAHTLACNIIDWHPDGKHIASGSLDKTVRVWDVSSSRKGRAAWEIRTPYPVMNARWRPSCESSMPGDNGVRQCTQLVTAYDREHPVIHIWDFRRPALPFREMAPYKSAPTDLLWHSQDLLWTVGREGVFLQCDIQHAPKVIDERNLQSFAISPRGEINLVVQKRRQRRLPKLHNALSSVSQTPPSLGVSLETSFTSRSWEDDGLDHSFLSVNRRKNHSRSSSVTKVPVTGRQPAVLVLDEILHHRKSFSPQQQAVRGAVPHQAAANVFEYLAQEYSAALEQTTLDGMQGLENVSRAFERSAEAARRAGLYRLAQTWRIVGFAALGHVKARSTHLCAVLPTAKRCNVQALGELAKKLLTKPSPAQSPVSVRPATNLAERLGLPESSSNVPTPLARPVQDDHRDVPNGELTTLNLTDHDQRETTADRNEMVRRWSSQPGVPLSSQPAEAIPVSIPPRLMKHDSDESFAFLESSTASRGPSLPASFKEQPVQMVSAHPSRVVAEQPSNTNEATEAACNQATDEIPPRPPADAKFRKLQTPESSKQDASKPHIDNAGENRMGQLQDRPVIDSCVHDLEAEKPFALVDMLKELLTYHASDAQLSAHLILLLIPFLSQTHPLQHGDTAICIEKSTEAFTAAGSLPQEVVYIVEKYLGHVILAGLNPLQIESILCTYEEQLRAHRLWVEAVKLRKFAYPGYPVMYEDALKDVDVHMKCTGCGKPVQNGNSHPKCARDGSFSCPYCWMLDSPFGFGTLWTSCLLCGHSLHQACAQQWFGDEEGDGCPIEGCLCDCVGGLWRDEVLHAAPKPPQKIRSDEWEVAESKAVKDTKAALRV